MTTQPQSSFSDKVFKDKEGHVVLWQWPNIPLYGWLAFKLLALVITQKHLKTGFDLLSTAFLFTWAYLETTQGVNYFRKFLGLVVLVGIVISFFR